MNSRERMLTAIRGEEPDRVPLYCWCFGVGVPPHLRWRQDGREVAHWYTMRLEHIHTLPDPWSVQHDFKRVKRWFSLGVDDVLEVSPPWGVHPEVRIRDWQEPPTDDQPYPLLCREYETPVGPLHHIVQRTEGAAESGPGWVVQPDHVPLFEDFNIPRGVKHAVAGAEDIPKLRYLLHDPTKGQLAAYRERMAVTQRFAREEGVLVQGWSAFGLDAVIWLCGVEGAVLFAMDDPDAFQALSDLVHAFDRRRTEIMLDVGGVDVVVERGWYSSTSFWSPTLFRRYVLPHLQQSVEMAHQAGALYAYTTTTGVLTLADQLIEAGIDLLYFVDPVQDRADLAAVKEKFGGKIACAGGINSALTLGSGTREEIRKAVHSAVQTLAPGGGFILSPVDALYPDTEWATVEAMVDAWREVCDYPIR